MDCPAGYLVVMVVFFAKCYDYKDEDIHHVIKFTSYDHETANMLKMKMFTEWSTVKAKVAS